MSRLYLASASPRRKALLEEEGISFTLLAVDVDESHDAGQDPAGVAEVLALRKARAGARTLRDGLVLGADTVVVVKGSILGKPKDRTDSERMLRLLSGTTHHVLTGVALVHAGSGRARSAVDSTAVTMRPLGEAEIEAYVRSGEGDDKAGAYAIQENGDRFVTRLDGSWSNVVGLPMELVTELLREAGLGSTTP